MTKKQREVQEARETLLQWIKPGDTVYTILNHVSASGMSRAIRVVLLKGEADGSVMQFHPNWSIGRLLGLRHWKKNGREQDALVLGGCGMDMGFHLVSNLSRALFPDGFECTGEHCPSNDHSNGDRNREKHWHNSPDYALHHEWL